mmetsp:Transcript_6990/g.14330  ORF Transcript_6990/g.14330 Transcript_6990/m.14330 type:complete len:191 (-) Transcript_6990:182-754(-)|eukprot:scaffold3400_cov169-Amphora_coffeaeformis.AAC.15
MAKQISSVSDLFDPIPFHFPSPFPTTNLLETTPETMSGSKPLGARLEPTPFRDGSAPSPHQMTTPHSNLEKPKRPLTAYNMFFQHERQVLLASLPVSIKSKRGHGKITFADLAKVIGKRWKEADFKTRMLYCERANEEKLRYHKAMDEYRSKKRESPIPETSLEPLDVGIPLLADQLGDEMTDLVIRALR